MEKEQTAMVSFFIINYQIIKEKNQMVTINSAEKALKVHYLDVVANQLNTQINPFLAKIKSSTKDVWGKQVKKLAPIGINGGIGAGTEDGTLPSAAQNMHLNFVSDLKNLYGTIEISDKAIRASENNVGAFVNLLNDEMEGLVKAATFNFGRMLYGDGSGILGKVVTANIANKTVTLSTDAKNVIEGMVVDFYNNDTLLTTARISAIDRSQKPAVVQFSSAITGVATGSSAYVANSKGNELSGLGAIFNNTATIYGVERQTSNFFLRPYIASSAEINDLVIQEAIDAVEEATGSSVDFIVTTPGVRRKYLEYLQETRRNVNTTTLDGGFSAITFNGIPIHVDRFCPAGTMYLLDSKKFTIHQLCDWRWLEGDSGNILKQNAGKPTYTATLVKYAELICDLPGGQAMIKGITE